MNQTGCFQFAIDPVAAVDKLVSDVLSGRDGSGRTLADPERQVLYLLRDHRGAQFAKPLAEIAAKLSMGDREVKATIKSLLEDFSIPIGGSRQAPYGYFLCVTAEDYESAERPLVSELRSIARRLKALGRQHRIAEVMGQLQLEEQPKAKGAHA